MIYYVNLYGKGKTFANANWWFKMMESTKTFPHWTVDKGMNLSRLRCDDYLIVYASKIETGIDLEIESGGFIAILQVKEDIYKEPDSFYMSHEEHSRIHREIFCEENPGKEAPADLPIRWVESSGIEPEKAMWAIPVEIIMCKSSLNERITKEDLKSEDEIYRAGSGIIQASYLKKPEFFINLMSKF